jgi:hypothetical protein
MFAAVFKDNHQTAVIRSIRFLGSDLASVDADWHMTGARTPDGVPRPPRKGLLDFAMARRSDRSWLIEVMHNTVLNCSSAASPAR